MIIKQVYLSGIPLERASSTAGLSGATVMPVPGVSQSKQYKGTVGKIMREIVKVPAPILHTISQPIKDIDELVREVAEEMLLLLGGVSRIPCLGLAAVQLGEPIRLIAVMWNMYSRDYRTPVIIVNPEIIKCSEKMVESREGCLSIGKGDSIYTVKRYKQVKVKGLDISGKTVVYKERGLPGYAFQHEIDHLDGKLICD